MRFTGTTVLRLQNGKIVEEIGLDDGVTAYFPQVEEVIWSEFSGDFTT
jgi:hypothetical protein